MLLFVVVVVVVVSLFLLYAFPFLPLSLRHTVCVNCQTPYEGIRAEYSFRTERRSDENDASFSSNQKGQPPVGEVPQLLTAG